MSNLAEVFQAVKTAQPVFHRTLQVFARVLRSSATKCQADPKIHVERRNFKVRAQVSIFIETVARSLFVAAGPFGLDELDDARFESMCAARKLLKSETDVKGAIAHVRNAVGRVRCDHVRATTHHV